MSLITLKYSEGQQTLKLLEQCKDEWNEHPPSFSQKKHGEMKCYEYLVDIFSKSTQQLCPTYLAFGGSPPKNLCAVIKQIDTDFEINIEEYKIWMVKATYEDLEDFNTGKSKLNKSNWQKEQKTSGISGALFGLGGFAVAVPVTIISAPVGLGVVVLGGVGGAFIGGVTHLVSHVVNKLSVDNELREISCGSTNRINAMTRIASEEYKRIKELFEKIEQRKKKLETDIATKQLSHQKTLDAEGEIDQISAYKKSLMQFYINKLPDCLEASSDDILGLLKKNRDFLNTYKISPGLANDPKFVRQMLDLGGSLKHASENLRSDIEIVLKAIELDVKNFEWAGSNIKDDPILVSQILELGGSLQYASEKLRDDPKTVLKAIGLNIQNFYWAGNKCCDDKEIVLVAVGIDGNSLRFASYRLKGDKDVVEKALGLSWRLRPDSRGNGLGLLDCKIEYTSNEVKDKGEPFQYISSDLLKDEPFMLYVAKHRSDAVKNASYDLRESENFIISAYHARSHIRPAPEIFKEAGYKLQSTKSYAFKIVKIDGDYLRYTCLTGDKDVVKEAIQNNVNAYCSASNALKNDQDIVNLVVEKLESGSSFSYNSDVINFEIKYGFGSDRIGLFLSSIKWHDVWKNCWRLNRYAIAYPQYIPAELWLDQSYVLSLLYTASYRGYDEGLFKMIPSHFWGNKDFVLEAIQKHPQAYHYISEYLKTDRAFMKEVNEKRCWECVIS